MTVNCVFVVTAGAQLESEQAKALSHEASAEELKQRLASLQELKLKEQLQHSEAIKRLLADIEEAQAKVAQVSEVKKQAEYKYITARKTSTPSSPPSSPPPIPTPSPPSRTHLVTSQLRVGLNIPHLQQASNVLGRAGQHPDTVAP